MGNDARDVTWSKYKNMNNAQGWICLPESELLGSGDAHRGKSMTRPGDIIGQPSGKNWGSVAKMISWNIAYFERE